MWCETSHPTAGAIIWVRCVVCVEWRAFWRMAFDWDEYGLLSLFGCFVMRAVGQHPGFQLSLE